MHRVTGRLYSMKA
ncbi:hypothetical protein IEO21_04632 [Rhodonia placenta]|uniref:Uncharacterized protein n=1 Tax=Rhodonia placenta TaxID=104341 RepID=A0A8H7U2S7_9APHY|nr:hypothetical protein IEO21_04632 [Postia placenta]